MSPPLIPTSMVGAAQNVEHNDTIKTFLCSILMKWFLNLPQDTRGGIGHMALPSRLAFIYVFKPESSAILHSINEQHKKNIFHRRA